MMKSRTFEASVHPLQGHPLPSQPDRLPRRDLEGEGDTCPSNAAMRLVADQDEWAWQWINVNRLQAIVEAFDDDASGFVTIAEVNHFTASRPEQWR